MKRAIRNFFLVFLLLGSGMVTQAGVVEPDIFVPIVVTGVAIQTESWGFGLDAAGTDGLDETLDIPKPPIPPAAQNDAFFGLLGEGSATYKVRDVRGAANNVTIPFGVDFGSSGAGTEPPEDIVISWDTNGVTTELAQFTTREIRDEAGESLRDLAIPDGGLGNDATFTFTAGDGDRQQIFFVLLQDVNANAPPLVTDDEENVFVSDANPTIEIDVVTNDEDPDAGDQLTITKVFSTVDAGGLTTTTDQDGTATINQVNTTIDYTPPAGPGGFEGEDTFMYTISDGTTTATGAVTLNVFSGDVRGTRGHNPTVQAGAAITVTITINISDAVKDNLTKFEVREVLPKFDDAADAYFIPAGGGTDGLAVGGTDPPLSVAGNNDQREITFDFINGGRDLNDGSVVFTYDAQGSEDDDQPKPLSGKIVYRTDTDIEDIVVDINDSEFLPVTTHPTDTNRDFKITLFEFLGHAGPVAAVFQQGASGEYNFNGTTLAPRSPATGHAPITIHPADTDSDFSISLFEYLLFAGPVAAVFQEGVNGGDYDWDGTELTPVRNQ